MSASEKDWMARAFQAAPPVRAVAPSAAEAVEVEGAEPHEDVHPSKAYGGLWNRRDRAHMVEFRPLDPEKPAEAFDYNHLPRVRWHKGRGEIVLLYETLGVKVVIRGLNLADLKERLEQHMVTWVQEQATDPVAVRLAQDEARAEGRDLVLVQEIGIFEQGLRPECPDDTPPG
jgi:hypothetical protein